MASTKDIKRQERRKKDKQKKVVIILIAAAVICAGAFGIYRLVDYLQNRPESGDTIIEAPPEREWDPLDGTRLVATINGNEIYEAEFMYHFYTTVRQFEQTAGTEEIWIMDFDSQTAEDAAKHETLKRIRQLKEMVRRAEELDLYPDPRRLIEAKERAAIDETLLPEYMVQGWKVTAEVIQGPLEEALYSQLLFQYYTNDIGVETDEQREELQTAIDAETEFWTNDAMEKAEAAGEVFEPFTEQELFEIEERVTNAYLDYIRLQYFEEIYADWMDDIEIIINDEVFDNITVLNAKGY